ncbi:MAG: DNA-binding protein [Candidatus Neomarinimicrobiota bacterium]
MNFVNKTTLLLLAGTLMLAGCQKKTPPQQHEQPVAVAGNESGISGTVMETMDSGGYTYVRINDGQDDIWAAAPVTRVEVGARVTIPEGMVMENFESASLQRTFEKIHFVSEISNAGKRSMKAAPGGHPGQVRPQSGTPEAQIVAIKNIIRLKDGISVAELYKKGPQLAGERIRLRGEVVKFNANIMGRNWLHIQDGTGSDGDFDLTVTTSATAAVGDVVIIDGFVAVDQDFGFGYKYALIVEDAKIATE